MNRRVSALLSCVCVLTASELFSQPGWERAAFEHATASIRPEQIRSHMRFLSDSLLQGRAPGTAGYDIAARYVATELEGMGLDAGVSGNWYQPVPLEKAVTDTSKSFLVLTSDGKEQKLVEAQDYVLSAWFASPAKTAIGKAESDVNAPVIFAGFGVTAQKRGHDDYAGIDVRGKVVVTIYGAPAAFPSTERAYFADSVVKSKNAIAHGAVGMLSIMLPEDWKRFPWDWIVPQAHMGEMHWLDSNGVPHDFFPQLRGGALLSEQGASLLFSAAPKSLEAIFATARASKAQAFPLPVVAHIHTSADESVIQSPNIVAKLTGSDPSLRQQYLVYTAHLDHLGLCPAADGDNVCHGALDNASGVSTLLEIARAYASLARPPRRSVLFAFVSGEEMGLLGSDYFAHFPTVPLKSIVANINIDGAPGFLFPMKDVVALGGEHSTMADDVSAAGRLMAYEMIADPMPEELAFIRSDQYSFVLQGVPALELDDADSADPNINGIETNRKWLVTRYHTPLDNMEQPLNFESAAKGAVLNFMVGYEVVQRDVAPEWNKGDFFGMSYGSRHSAH